MANNKEVRLPLPLKIHNVTCPAWVLKIGFLRKIEPGCRIVQKRLAESRSGEAR